MYHSFLIHSSADGHLGCFHVLTIINSAAMNIGAHVSFSILNLLILGGHGLEAELQSGSISSWTLWIGPLVFREGEGLRGTAAGMLTLAGVVCAMAHTRETLSKEGSGCWKCWPPPPWLCRWVGYSYLP